MAAGRSGPERRLGEVFLAMRVSRSAEMIALAAATAAVAVPAPATVPFCGADELRMANGTVVSVNLYALNRAEVRLHFRIPTQGIERGPFSFDGSAELELRYGWPHEDFAPRIQFSWPELAENGRPAEGILQFACGSRNMGLVNFEVRSGLVMKDSPNEDLVDCLHELDRDGAFQVMFDRRNAARTVVAGTIALRAARRRANQFIEREVARERTGRCMIRPMPVPF